MPRSLLTAIGALAITAAASKGEPVEIIHPPVQCAVAGQFPRLEARLEPAVDVATARILFQTTDAKGWYAVAMKASGPPAFAAVLPKPKKALKQYRYYIEVTDTRLQTTRTAEYVTAVVGSKVECEGKVIAPGVGAASVLLQAPAGAPAIPAGFSPAGVAGVTTGASAGAATTAAAAAGGSHTALLVGGGILAAGGAAAAVVASHSGGDNGGGSKGRVSLEGRVVQATNAGPGAAIAGATVGTSLDSNTTVTDSAGHFFLQTGAPAVHGTDLYTVTVTAPGCRPGGATANWGDNPTGLVIQLSCP